MEIDHLLLAGLAILLVPLLGTTFALALGVLVTLTRRPREATGEGRLQTLEFRLRRAAALFGCYVADDAAALARQPRRAADARVVFDRRICDRRLGVRRQLPRAGADRRHGERRMHDRRRFRQLQDTS